ncbi:MAG TPA: hypothetical protein VFE48_19515 [Methylomirabilota bacterium]|nr:hypothetical protein [Methylomirabilota bacterium]
MSGTRLDWGRFLAITSTAGFIASAVLHLATFTPLPPVYAAAVGLVLLVGAFVLLGAMIARLRRSRAPMRGEGPVRMVSLRTLLGHIPEGPRRAGAAVILYVVMNLGLSLLLGDQAVASVRLLSGHLLLFYLIPLMYFRFVEPRLRDGDGASQPVMPQK